jgi:head-tail adaptor
MVMKFDKFKAMDVLNSKNFMGSSQETSDANVSLKVKIADEIQRLDKSRSKASVVFRNKNEEPMKPVMKVV